MPKKNLSNLITCKNAAEILGFTAAYIRRLILDKKIKAEKIGHDWIMTEKDIQHIKRQRCKKKGIIDNEQKAV